MHSELQHPGWRFFVKTVSDQEPFTLFPKKLRLQCLNRLWIHLSTPELIYYIKIKTGTSQSAELLQVPWSMFSAKFKVTAKKKTQLRCYEDILLTGNCLKSPAVLKSFPVQRFMHISHLYFGPNWCFWFYIWWQVLPYCQTSGS